MLPPLVPCCSLDYLGWQLLNQPFLFFIFSLPPRASPVSRTVSIIGQKGGRKSPHRDEAVHHNVCGTFGGEFGCGDGEHVRETAKAIREEEDV